MNRILGTIACLLVLLVALAALNRVVTVEVLLEDRGQEYQLRIEHETTPMQRLRGKTGATRVVLCTPQGQVLRRSRYFDSTAMPAPLPANFEIRTSPDRVRGVVLYQGVPTVLFDARERILYPTAEIPTSPEYDAILLNSLTPPATP